MSGFYLLLAALMLLTMVPIWCRRRRHQLDIFEPPVWLSLYCLVVFGLTSIPYLHEWSPINSLLQPATLWLGPALGVVVMAVLCMWLGYSLPLIPLPKPGAVSRQGGKCVKATWIIGLSALGICLRLYMVSSGYFGYLMVREDYFGNLAASQTLGQLSIVGRMGFLLAAIDWFQQPHSVRRRTVFLGLLVVELFFATLSGMKSQFVFPVVLVLMAYYYVQRRFPTRYLVLASLALLILTPITNAYRGAINSGQIDRTAFSSSAGSTAHIATDIWEQRGPVQMVADGATAMLSRLSLLPSVAHVIRYIDETGDLWYGKTYVYLPAMVFVPRFLWEDKPVIEMGYWFSQTVLRAPSNMYNSEAITVPGDLYLNFGLPGVCVGFLLFGLILRALYQWGVRRGDASCLFAYLLVWLSLMQLESDALSLGAGVLKLLLLLLIVRRFAFYRGAVRMADPTHSSDAKTTRAPASNRLYPPAPTAR